jgi:hypothetical protein
MGLPHGRPGRSLDVELGRRSVRQVTVSIAGNPASDFGVDDCRRGQLRGDDAAGASTWRSSDAFYRYENNVTCHDSLCDVFPALDPKLFKASFAARISDLRGEDPDIAVGKRRDAATENGSAAIPCTSLQPGRFGNSS